MTYLQYGLSAKAYLSAIKDLYDGSIIAYEISHNNDNPLVIKTIKKALKLNPGATPIIHSDRGSQYTSKEYRYITQQAGLTLSMSRVESVLTMHRLKVSLGILRQSLTISKTIRPMMS